MSSLTFFSRDSDDEAQQCNDDEGINRFLELAQQQAQGFLEKRQFHAMAIKFAHLYSPLE